MPDKACHIKTPIPGVSYMVTNSGPLPLALSKIPQELKSILIRAGNISSLNQSLKSSLSKSERSEKIASGVKFQI
jgi:hypothetical protein